MLSYKQKYSALWSIVSEDRLEEAKVVRGLFFASEDIFYCSGGCSESGALYILRSTPVGAESSGLLAHDEF